MKEIWYDFVKENKEYWTNGMTLIRLEKVKNSVFADSNIMWDLMTRHGAKSMTPNEMKAFNKQLFDHCIGNFVCNIHYKMMDMKLIKG